MCTPVHLKSYDTHGTDWLISQCWPLCWEDMSDIEFLFKVRIGNSFYELFLLLALLGVKPGASRTLHQRSGHEDTLPALPFNIFSLTLCAFSPLLPFKPFILFLAVLISFCFFWCGLLHGFPFPPLLWFLTLFYYFSPFLLKCSYVCMHARTYVCVYVYGGVWCRSTRRRRLPQDVWCHSLLLPALSQAPSLNPKLTFMLF